MHHEFQDMCPVGVGFSSNGWVKSAGDVLARSEWLFRNTDIVTWMDVFMTHVCGKCMQPRERRSLTTNRMYVYIMHAVMYNREGDGSGDVWPFFAAAESNASPQ